MAEEKQEGQKTLIAFIVGLLIGGLLVWAFSGPSANAPAPAGENDEVSEETSVRGDTSDTSDNNESETTEEMTTEMPVLEVGDGSVVVDDQPASNSIVLESVTYPISEGWIGVREYDQENLGFILGVVRFSESQNLVPNEITLQRSTTAGRDYAIVIYTESGDSGFNLAEDVQIDAVFDTFTAK